jgi:hypothetical protein
MGIDIRNGQQLECITCALCIDACNEVMDKIGKPRGLIGYIALKDEPAERAGQHPKNVWKHVFRPRTILYTALWSAVGIGMVVALFMRSPIGLNVTPGAQPALSPCPTARSAIPTRCGCATSTGEDGSSHISVTSDEPSGYGARRAGQYCGRRFLPTPP